MRLGSKCSSLYRRASGFRQAAGATALLWCVSGLFGSAFAQLLSPSFTAEQLASGKEVYGIHCASCHGAELSDGEFAPALKGQLFASTWAGKPLDAVFRKIVSTMPQAAPGSLPMDAYVDILAFILQNNGAHAGKNELPADLASLARIVFPAPGYGGIVETVALPPPPEPVPNPLPALTEVTEEMLVDPPAGDWLTLRRSVTGQGYSPLAQINRENVGGLSLAWSWALPAGPSHVPPLVHDGVLYIQGWGDSVQALDARSGELLWQYTHWLPKERPANKKSGIAIFGSRIYLGTSDARVMALDARTGDVIWDKRIAEGGDKRGISGGPLVAAGRVFIGTAGAREPGGNYIVALDAATGAELWRFGTIPKPGEPGGNSWNGLPWEARTGASVWNVGSYDPESGLVYFGTGQTYDTGPLLEPRSDMSVSNDALYTDTTLALDAETGELAWHFQHLPNDQWDLDWAYEQVLFRLPEAGETKTFVVTGGKSGIHNILEAGSGAYVGSIDPGLQDFITAIDPETGAVTIDPQRVPSRDRTVTVCPHADGAKNWFQSAYHPGLGLLYVPLMEICMDLVPVPEGETGSLSLGVRWTGRPRPDSDGRYGRLQAMDLATRKLAWASRQRAPLTNGLLATGGGLVFSGDLDRNLKAFDAESGEVLWSSRLGDAPSAPSITFTAGGRQYIAVTTGHGRLANARSLLVPEIKLPTQPTAMLWVFAIP